MLTSSTCSATSQTAATPSSVPAAPLPSIKSRRFDSWRRSTRPRSNCKHRVTAEVAQPATSCISDSLSGNNRRQRYLLAQPQINLRSQHHWECRQGSNDNLTTNGAGGKGGQGNSNGNGSIIADAGSNSGEGSNGYSGGSNGPSSKVTSSGDHGDGSSNNKLPASRELVIAAAAAVLGFIAVTAAGAIKWSAEAHQTASAALAAVSSKGNEHSVAGLSTKDSINALKRLLREVFQDQLGLKSRLDALETAAAAKLEAADDYQLQLSGADRSNSCVRSPVRMSGWFSAEGVLPWTQEAAGTDTAAMLAALGASGQADGRLALHSVLAGGKRRVTAELQHAQQDDGQPCLQLAKLLYRVQVKPWLQLMIAPLGGSLDAVARGITPIQADYGCTQALRKGHGFSVFDHFGSGKAAAVSKGCLSAAAGFFVRGTSKASLLQLQLKGHEGCCLSLVAAKHRPREGSTASNKASSSSSKLGPGFRFLGVHAPGCSSRGNNSSSGSCERASTVLGAAGVVPIGDSLTATAWAEKPSTGQAGWGFGLYSQPDPQGFEAGMVLGKPSSQHAAFSMVQVPLFCELTAKVPVGDGLSISPGALVTFREGKGTLAYLMQSSWRF